MLKGTQQGYVFCKGSAWFVRAMGNIYEQYKHPKTRQLYLRFVRRGQICKKLPITAGSTREQAVACAQRMLNDAAQISDLAAMQLVALEKKYKEKIEWIHRKEAERELKMLRKILRDRGRLDAHSLPQRGFLTVRF